MFIKTDIRLRKVKPFAKRNAYAYTNTLHFNTTKKQHKEP